MKHRVRYLIRYGYFPLMFIGGNGAAVLLAFADLTARTRASAALALMAAALLAAFAAERALPYRRSWNRDRGDTRRDIAHFLANESLSVFPLVFLPLFIASESAPGSHRWPSAWPSLLQALFAIALFDLGQTLFHRASHRFSLLWRFHEVHHSVERMYGLNGILKHPVYQIVSSAVAFAPLLFLGIPKQLVLVVALCSFVQLLLQHSNVDYRTGAIRRICSTAEVHRFHHLRGRAGDVNFALFFSFWDHSFATAYFTPKTLGTRDIGLEDCDYPRSYWGQLLEPMRRESGLEAGEEPR